MDDITLTLIDSFEEAEAFMRWLGETRDSAIAVDTETEGFHWWRDRIRLVQIGDARHGWAMRWDRWSGLVQEFLRRYDGRIVMHNFKFDSEFLIHYGMDLPMHRIDDTRTMAHLVDPARATGLKPLSDELLWKGASAGQDRLHKFMRSHKWDWRNVPYDLTEYWAYAALDTVLTAAIHRELEPSLRPRTALYDVEMAAQIALMKMEMKGARIDLQYVEQKGKELRDWADQTRAWARDNYGLVNGKPFNLGSNDQVTRLLQDDGWEPKEFTNGGKPKFTKEIAATLDHPLAKLVVQVKHAEKMASAYFDNFIATADGDRLHPKINPIGARTGRMSVTDPALQTLPRDALVRDAFVPGEGNRLVLIDYDQMEVRIMAHFDPSGELADAVLNQDDIHTYTAAQIYGVDESKVEKRQRQITKNAVYAILYGAGINKFSETAGIPVKEGKAFMERYNATYPGVPQFKAELEQLARDRLENGWTWVETPRGRLQRTEIDKSYKLLNYLIQGSGADVLKHKLAELDAAGFDEYMVLPVHDEIMFDVPAEDADELMHEAMKVMTDHEWKVPLTVDGVIVDRWGRKYS